MARSSLALALLSILCCVIIICTDEAPSEKTTPFKTNKQRKMKTNLSKVDQPSVTQQNEGDDAQTSNIAKDVQSDTEVPQNTTQDDIQKEATPQEKDDNSTQVVQQLELSTQEQKDDNNTQDDIQKVESPVQQEKDDNNTQVVQQLELPTQQDQKDDNTTQVEDNQKVEIDIQQKDDNIIQVENIQQLESPTQQEQKDDNTSQVEDIQKVEIDIHQVQKDDNSAQTEETSETKEFLNGGQQQIETRYELERIAQAKQIESHEQYIKELEELLKDTQENEQQLRSTVSLLEKTVDEQQASEIIIELEYKLQESQLQKQHEEEVSASLRERLALCDKDDKSSVEDSHINKEWESIFSKLSDKINRIDTDRHKKEEELKQNKLYLMVTIGVGTSLSLLFFSCWRSSSNKLKRISDEKKSK